MTLIIWTVWFLGTVPSSDGKLETLSKIVVSSSGVALFVVGLSLIRYGRQAILNTALVTVSIIFYLGICEILLRTGALDGHQTRACLDPCEIEND